jgi:hypothetical protein
MKNVPNILKSLLVTIIAGVILFYVTLPALNFQDEGFYFFLAVLAAIFFVVYIILTIGAKFMGTVVNDRSYKNLPVFKPFMIVVGIFVLIFVVGSILSVPLFRASAYRDLLKVETGNFTEDVAEISFNQIPLLDKVSAQKLGDRKMGELSDMVSQFEVSDEYAQINYKNRPYRVTSLYYSDVFKWLTNTSKGLPAYLRIDMITQNVEVVRLENGMKYSPAEHFSKLLARHIRFNYPTFMFEAPSFEIDDNGQPYWIVPRIIKTIGLFGGTDVNGAVIVNAVTGESKYYEKDDIPMWVDHVYPSDLIINQYNYHGKYINGFINSIFGQRGVTTTTTGYNYLALNDDIYVYTGITSIISDQSNIGFILTNQRTKETKFYSIPGATETSAMASAEGVVQHLNYKSTFPLLLNTAGEPTYFIALKDNASLVKQYAMVNVQKYQLVATGASVSECERNYTRLLSQTGNISAGENSEITGVISDIRTAVRDGNSYYYFKLDESFNYYSTSASQNEYIVTLNKGDRVKITFSQSPSLILQINTIEKITENQQTVQ